MDPIELTISPDLQNTGDSIMLCDVIDLPSYAKGEDTYTLKRGLNYDAVLTNTGDAILLTGIARSQAVGSCARCLEEAAVDIAAEIEGYYLLEEALEVEDKETDEFEVVSSEGTIDIAPAILAAVIHETPFVTLCHEDCLGLCPTCGVNLNDEGCSCEENLPSDSPFAVLKDLKLDDESSKSSS